MVISIIASGNPRSQACFSHQVRTMRSVVLEHGMSEQEDAKATPSGRRALVDWTRISGAERRAAWHDLARFVEYLVFRYDLVLEIMPCWWRHGAAVEELTALWHLRELIYRAGADLGGPMSWHNSFQSCRTRLQGVFVSCRDGHTDASISEWTTKAIQQDFITMTESE